MGSLINSFWGVDICSDIGGLFTDISDTVYTTKNFDVTTWDTAPTDVRFNNDGSKMFVVAKTGNGIDEFNLSTPYDVTTATHSYFFSTSGQLTNPWTCDFSDDGKFLLIGENTVPDDVWEYNLTTGYDLTTASYSGNSFTPDATTELFGIWINADGTRFWIGDGQFDHIKAYTMSTAHDLSTASYDGDPTGKYIFSDSERVSGIMWSCDGTKLIVNFADTDTLRSYTASTPFLVTSLTKDTQSYSYSGLGITSFGFCIVDGGTRMYIVDYDADVIYQYGL